MKLVVEPHQRVFYTSDTHYNHTNMCRGVSKWPDPNDTRDFQSLGQMNSAIVNSINSIVKEDDILFHLGDWSFGGYESITEFRNLIACKNIHLLLGNHDHHIERDKGGTRQLFSSVNSLLSLEIVIPTFKNQPSIKKTLILCHYPIASWQDLNRGAIHLHGHTHLSQLEKMHAGKSMDIGMDGNNMQVYSLSEILKTMQQRQSIRLTLPTDHHEHNKN